MRDWLKKERTDRGLTMAEMAKKLDLTESYYSRIEGGERQKKMDLLLVRKLASALDIPIEDIIRKEATTCQPQRTTASAATGANT